MTSVSSSFATVPRRQYVSTGIFTNNIFSYKTYINSSLQTRGTLAVLSGATDLKCAAGRILRENGKKLNKGTHPDLLDPNTQAQYHVLIGVYDVTTGLNGFIDPNAPVFAPFNTDKSYQHNLASEALDASGLQEEGAPVYTTGSITTTTGNILVSSGSVTSTKMNISPVASTNGSSGTPLTASAGRGTLAANNATIYTTACTANSIVLVTVNSGTAQKVSVVPAAGSFAVYTDAGLISTFNWMVIN